VVAEMIGWKGIWGGGSAFSDLIVPAPITGGIFRVPTFVLALFVIRAYPQSSSVLAGILRAAMLAAALVGLAQLVDLERVYLSQTTDLMLRGIPWERSIFGLSLMTDALWMLVLTHRRALVRTPWLAAVAIVILPPALYVYGSIQGNDRLREPFLHGHVRALPDRGDAARYAFTRMSSADPTFRDAAAAYADEFRPEKNPNVEDLAIYFTDSLHTARSPRGSETPLATLCLYEDGTPDRWQEGEADCFTRHTTFSERRTDLAGKAPEQVPGDVWELAVETALCKNVEIPEGRFYGRTLVDHCAGIDLAEMRSALAQRHEAAELDDLLKTAREALAPAKLLGP
jgi:hypothetical protein